MPTSSPSYIGTDLSDDHPVSIIYSDILVAARRELASPTTLTGRVRLDSFGQVQCTSCHDPHSDTYGKFLVMANQGSALCIACHVKNFWTQTSHNLSVATWNGSDPNPWPHTSGSTVAANGCENCHRPHTAGGRQWLMNYLAEENNCYSCHNGNVAQKDVQTEFLKYSHHPVETNVGVHDASRAVEPVVLPGNQRHVECVDCHNPHATNGSTGALPGSLLGVRGVDRFGNELGLAPFPPVTYEYQICFRCHADSSGQPAPRTNRQIAQSNLRLSMASGNPSYHPVLAPGVNTNVPSLLAPWTTASVMKCGDCHNNDTGPGAGDIGPTGPHGSNNPSLLERGYSTLDLTPYTYNAYALCFKCHDFLRFITTVVGAPFGSITGHAGHVVGQRTPCNVCHDPHGVSATQGNAINNSKLMNFDISVVSSVLINGVPTLKYEATTPGHGRCYLVCHGNIHNPRTY
jgi:predicted CXXCH cytochrome family protein